MKGIMFNTKYGLEQAVLRGYKTRTWRADKKPRFNCGEIAAIKQSYKQAITEETDTQYLQRIGEYWHKQYRKDEDESAQYSGSYLKGKRLQRVSACEAASKLILEAVEILKNGGVE